MNCSCWECRKNRGLSELAPSLTRAYYQIVERKKLKRKAESDLLRAQALLAHRDLQYCRAGARRNGKYLRHRARKLEYAEKLVAAIERHIEELSV